jgi:hypothetical protein
MVHATLLAGPAATMSMDRWMASLETARRKEEGRN